jgi:MYXO-CTERM domain-containing protein
MKSHPSELAAWAAQMAPGLGGWIDESQPAVPNDWTDWRNASAAWNMLAQFDAANALTGTDGDTHRVIALDILDKLWVQDDDGDGAIPGSQQRLGVDQDESWVSAYFTVFGLRQVSDGTATPDAGVEPDAGDDAGQGEDAGPVPTPPATTTTSGCSCDVARGNGTTWGILAALAAAVLAITRRRHRS